MEIGKVVKLERKKLKLRQCELAEEIGISNTYLSDIESGRTTPSVKTLLKLAKRLNLNIEKLLLNDN